MLVGTLALLDLERLVDLAFARISQFPSFGVCVRHSPRPRQLTVLEVALQVDESSGPFSAISS